MSRAFIIDGVRTPIGLYGGALSGVRPDDLAAHAIRKLEERQLGVDWEAADDVVLGCANQAGEDNRDVARMAGLLAGLPHTVPATTVNRLCGSGADAVAIAARAIQVGQAHVVAGGVESMSRAPFVVSKAPTAFARGVELHDTTLGWRFVNPALEAAYGTDSMGETADNVAAERGISLKDQDRFALCSQQRYAKARVDGRFEEEIVPLNVPAAKGGPDEVTVDEHPREVTMEALGDLTPAFRAGGTVTAGNASGVNDGAAAVLVVSEATLERLGVEPIAEVVSAAVAGVAPRVVGLGPIPVTRKLRERVGLGVGDLDLDLVELNEAFAAQALAVLRDLGLPDDAEHVNPNGGAIALGHPLGMGGARPCLTAALELRRRAARRAVATKCIGVGQGIAVLLERPR